MSSKDATAPRMEKIVSLCKRRGFIFQSSEIYGGLNGFWDYGPLGAELKRNLRDTWWQTMVRRRDDVVGLDASIIMHPAIWKASGHVDTFTDPMVDCKSCKSRHRADQLPDKGGVKFCPNCGSRDLTEPRPFNLMLRTHTGPVESAENVAYLRPETAQAIFVQFKNVHDSSRVKVPFGIAQIGKAFRNEINPRNYTFRSREFEQMELEFFIKPDEAIRIIHGSVIAWSEAADLSEPRPNWGWEMWHRYWVAQRVAYYAGIGLGAEALDYHWQQPDELAHYARATVDILYKFPFGTEELEGIAARGNFDLTQHQKHSGKPLEIFDEELKAAADALTPEQRQRFIDESFQARKNPDTTREEITAEWEKLFRGNYLPHVIEPSAGLDRLALAILAEAFAEETVTDEKGKSETRTVLRFHPRVAPTKVAIFPLLKNKPELVAKAREVVDLLRPHMMVQYDEAGAIGRRYRRQDEAGTPFCVTIDFDTVGENGPEKQGTVTLRHRDSMEQERIAIADLKAWLLEKIS